MHAVPRCKEASNKRTKRTVPLTFRTAALHLVMLAKLQGQRHRQEGRQAGRRPGWLAVIAQATEHPCLCGITSKVQGADTIFGIGTAKPPAAASFAAKKNIVQHGCARPIADAIASATPQ